MKHLFSLLVALLLSPTLFAQHAPLQSFIEQHKNKPGFTHAFLSHDLFEVASQSSISNKDWNGLHHVVKNIGSLSMLAADSITEALPLFREAKSLVPTDVFDELLTVRDGQSHVRVWAKSEENMVSDLVLLVGSPEEFVLVCFSGNLELGNIAELGSLFEAGQVERLAQASAAVSIDFGLSPNPSNGTFNVSYPDESDPPASLNILDQSGRLVSHIRLEGSPTERVALPDIGSGIYWMQLKTRQGKVGIKQMHIVK